jgi:molybdopterin converting factor small subunit
VSRVRIPPTLRTETGGEREVEADGGTVRDLLDDLMARFPALRERIWEHDEVAEFVNVYVEGEDVRTLDGLETTVRDGATVILLPAMAGGASAPLAGVPSRPAEPASGAASRRLQHRALRGRIAHTVPSGPALPATRQERGGVA